MRHSRRLLALLLLTVLASPLAAQLGPASSTPRDTYHRWRYVGSPGNPDSPNGVGRVFHTFLIGKYEVTNRQYVAFLNQKATVGDPLELYNPEMGLDPTGGILRTGTGTAPDPYRYEVLWPMGNKPVNFVSFYDSMRYANWLHNGGGTGDTETGSYLLLGGTPIPSNGTTVLRSPGATVVLPTEDEWYKAGHYDPATAAYSDYATRSALPPTEASATAAGGVANPGSNVANYNRGADWAGLDGNLTTVGGAGPSSESYYGCADMNGNVSEWNETTFTWSGLSYRKNRGGDYALDSSIMKPGHFGIVLPEHEASTIGFRVARLLP